MDLAMQFEASCAVCAWAYIGEFEIQNLTGGEVCACAQTNLYKLAKNILHERALEEVGAGEPQIRQLPRSVVDAMIPGEKLRPWGRKMQLRPWEEAALPLVGSPCAVLCCMLHATVRSWAAALASCMVFRLPFVVPVRLFNRRIECGTECGTCRS